LKLVPRVDYTQFFKDDHLRAGAKSHKNHGLDAGSFFCQPKNVATLVDSLYLCVGINAAYFVIV